MVVMGTGEPVDNYDNLLRFIDLLTDENGLKHQPEKSDGIHLWHCAENLRNLPKKSFQITLALVSACLKSEKRQELDAGSKQL